MLVLRKKNARPKCKGPLRLNKLVPTTTSSWWPFSRKVIFAIFRTFVFYGLIFTLLNNCHQQSVAVHNVLQEIDVIVARLDNFEQAVSNLVNEQIQTAFKKYDSDKTGLVDYALESGGGRIISTPDTKLYTQPWVMPLWGVIQKSDVFNQPEAIIRPGTQPGLCFAFAGFTGRIRIRLASPIRITSVTLEHAPFDIVPDTNSAPRDFSIYGLITEKSAAYTLGEFRYNVEGGSPLQTFHIPMSSDYDDINGMSYQIVELHIKSNHGHPNYTCVYRFRVHGKK